jgi:hypothetical protein
MGVSGHGSIFCLWAVRARFARTGMLTESWAMPPTAGAMKIEGGGACLHLSSQLCLALRPSRLVSCCISQRLSLSLSSRLHPEPWPPPFITSQPFFAPLLFGWLSRCPSALTLTLLQLSLVPRPPPLVDPLLVTVFGIVCRRSRRRIHPLRRHLPQSGGPQTSPFWVSSQRASVASAGPPLLLPLPGAPSRLSVASVGSPPPLPAARARCQGVSESESIMFVFREHCWSWAKKPVVLAGCDKINTKLTKIAVLIFSWGEFW